MTFFRRIQHPSILDTDIDSSEYINIKRDVLMRQKSLKGAYLNLYKRMLKARLEHCEVFGAEIEIGSGASVFKEVHPHITTSDIELVKGVDMYLDAHDMDIEDDSVAALYGINVLHHLSMPRCFYYEAERVLKKGGVCVLIEPRTSLLSRLLFKIFESPYRSDKSSVMWEMTENGEGSIPNTSLSYINFIRDRILWEREFPSLSIEECHQIKNPLSMFLSGMFGGKQLVPAVLIQLSKFIDIPLNALSPFFSLKQIIVIKKVSP